MILCTPQNPDPLSPPLWSRPQSPYAELLSPFSVHPTVWHLLHLLSICVWTSAFHIGSLNCVYFIFSPPVKTLGFALAHIRCSMFCCFVAAIFSLEIWFLVRIEMAHFGFGSLLCWHLSKQHPQLLIPHLDITSNCIFSFHIKIILSWGLFSCLNLTNIWE